MTRVELARAVEQPTARVGLEFEPGLLSRLLDDVGNEPGNLPLLEFALTSLWEMRKGRLLSHEAYERIGQISGAIAKRADYEFTRFSREQQDAARRLFGRLVRVARPEEGGQDTRQRASLNHTDPVMEAVVKALVDARLVVTGTTDKNGPPIVEVAHEALISSWDRLRDWVNHDREFFLWRQRLGGILNEWQRTRSEAALLSKAASVEAASWMDSRITELDLDEITFIRSSQEYQEHEEQRWKSLYEQAQYNLNIALARHLAMQAELLREEQPDMELSALLAIESMRKMHLFENDRALRCVLSLLHTTVACFTHKDRIRDVAFSPDGRLVVTASADDTAGVFEVATGNKIVQLDHKHMRSVSISPDGRLVIIGAGKYATVFEATTGRVISSLPHKDDVFVVAFSPDGSLVATGSSDGTARVFDSVTGIEYSRISHKGYVRAVAFSPDGRNIASVSETVIEFLGRSYDGDVVLFDALSGREIWRLNCAGTVTVVFSPDGRYLAIGGHGHVAEVIVLGTWERRPIKHPDSVNAVAFSPDTRHLATACGDRIARIFDLEALQQLFSLRHQGYVVDVAFSSDGRYLATASHDHTARLIDMATRQELARTGHSKPVNAVAFSYDSRYLVSASDDGTARVIETENSRRTLCLNHESHAIRLAFTQDGSYLVTSSNVVRIFETATGRETYRFHPEDTLNIKAISLDAKYVAGYRNGTVLIVDIRSSREILQINIEATINAMAFSANGRYLAILGEHLGNGETHVLDVLHSRVVCKVKHGDESDQVALSPDGQYIAIETCYYVDDFSAMTIFETSTGGQVLHCHGLSRICTMVFDTCGSRIAVGSRDGTVQILETISSKRTLQANHQDQVIATAFSPDGRYLATASRDRTARIFDIESGGELSRLTHGGAVRALAFDSSGGVLTTASQIVIPDSHDLTLNRHLLYPEDLIKEAHSYLSRAQLTPEELNQYLKPAHFSR